MADGEEDIEDANDLLSLSSEEEIQVYPTKTPTHHNLPLTITIKKHYKEKRQQKPRTETTWTQAYLDITLIEESWINEGKNGKRVQKNRLWTYKLCGPEFSFTNKECHGNTSRLNTHLRD
jgi:hypothetical protein